ncbi:hypothetical protein [Polaromonas sp.]|uniref:hypothetical protein n=1 Tax=Polaromonas sp. TaxID=1869339 RepID=UPI00326768CD
MFSDSSANQAPPRGSDHRRAHGLMGAVIAYVSVVSVGVAAAAAVVGAGIPVEILTASF